MAAPTGSIVNEHSDTFEEVINRNMGLFMPTLDYVFRNTVVSNQGVVPVDQIGRDFKVLKVYSGSYAGVAEPGGPTDDFTIYGDPQNTQLGPRVFRQGLGNTWPSARGGANARRKRLGMPLRSILTNLMWTIGELQSEALEALIGELIVPKLEGHAQYLSHMLCNYWYLSQNSYYALHTLGDTSGDIVYEESVASSGTYDVMVIDTKDSNYAIDRVWIGMRLNYFDSTGVTKARTTTGEDVFVVTYVDETTGIYKVMAADGSALASGASTGTISNGGAGNFAGETFDSGIAVFANSKGTATTPYSQSPYFTGIPGINSWLKCGTGGNDNYLLGAERDTSNAIDVTRDFGEMKSMKYSLGGQPLTEHAMRGILKRFTVAKRKYMGHDIDCLLASDGVWLAYEEARMGREWVDRTSRRPNLRQQGIEGDAVTDAGLFEFEANGKIYKGYTSTFIESGTVYGIKKGGNNWKRIVPPDPKGAKRDSRVPEFIPFRFAGPIVNNGQVAMPILQVGDDGTTLMTEGVQTPGMIRMSLMPENPSMLKLTNVAESRIYGDVA